MNEIDRHVELLLQYRQEHLKRLHAEIEYALIPENATVNNGVTNLSRFWEVWAQITEIEAKLAVFRMLTRA